MNSAATAADVVVFRVAIVIIIIVVVAVIITFVMPFYKYNFIIKFIKS